MHEIIIPSDINHVQYVCTGADEGLKEQPTWLSFFTAFFTAQKCNGHFNPR